MPTDKPLDADPAIDAAVRLRDRLLSQERWLTSEDVAALARTDREPDTYTEELRSRKAILGVRYQHRHLHPACQFDAAGAPLRRLEELLEILLHSGDGWSCVFWFFRPTGRLRGKRPADVLATDPETVISAARLDFEGDPTDW